jgi:uncharacterized protein YbjT (DUF2867 family)
MMVLVTGAPGQVGLHLVEELNDARVAVTAMVRADAKAMDLPPSVDHVVARLDDPPPVDVLREFDRVFLTSPSRGEEAELEVGFVDALVTAGHRPRVAKLSATGSRSRTALCASCAATVGTSTCHDDPAAAEGSGRLRQVVTRLRAMPRMPVQEQ